MLFFAELRVFDSRGVLRGVTNLYSAELVRRNVALRGLRGGAGTWATRGGAGRARRTPSLESAVRSHVTHVRSTSVAAHGNPGVPKSLISRQRALAPAAAHHNWRGAGSLREYS
eukprot:355900-Prymnesium_polylepis.1